MRKHINKHLRKYLALFLIPMIFVAGCSVGQFESILNQVAPAILNIIQIVALVRGVPANTALATKVSGDVSLIETLYHDFQTASGTAKPSVQAQINVAFDTLQNDLDNVFSLAQVSNVNTQAKITALIGLVRTSVGIAEAMINPNNNLKASAAPPINLSPEDIISSYNKILTAKTGDTAVDNFTSHHKLHLHNRTVRTLTLGFAH